MSLQSRPIPPIPELTAKVACAAFRKDNVCTQMRDVLGAFFTDDQFTDLYPADGQPAYAPWRLALVSVMQLQHLASLGVEPVKCPVLVLSNEQ